MKLVVDGVFFQLNNTGIARVWEMMLKQLAEKTDWQITLLDRGNAPRIDGVDCHAFPTYRAATGAADSALIQKLCDHLQADVFTTTYYSSPLTTPMTLMVYDMIPEIFDFDMSLRDWMEKGTALTYAQRFLCISQSTRRDLLRFYPEIPGDHARVAYCGVDTATFHKRPAAEVSAFRRQFGLERPYFLFVGSRVQHKSYKNSDLFFSALHDVKKTDFDVFCVGGEPEIEPQILEALPEGVRCRRVVLSDEELALAYGGAMALVYPSLYEGFGMPVIEAMAAGCPVITTQHGSLLEAAGDAALLVEGTSVPEMTEALTRIQSPKLQNDLRRRGLAHAAQFRWEPMAELLIRQIEETLAASKAPASQAFFAEWSRLRQLQVNVDWQV